MPDSKSTPPPSDDDEVDETSVESFPASDAPSWAMGRRSEPPPAPAPENGGGRPRRVRRPDDQARPIPSKR